MGFAIPDNELNALARSISDAVDPSKIYLFGSHARGTADKNSDLDLLVIVPGMFGPDNSRRDTLRRVRRAISSFRYPKDILVFSLDEFNKWKDTPMHVIGQCVQEGKLLHERA